MCIKLSTAAAADELLSHVLERGALGGRFVCEFERASLSVRVCVCVHVSVCVCVRVRAVPSWHAIACDVQVHPP